MVSLFHAVLVLCFAVSAWAKGNLNEPTRHGFIRVATGTPRISLGNPRVNGERILAMARQMGPTVSVALFPELSMTGYTIGDRVFNSTLQRVSIEALSDLAREARYIDGPKVLIVGAPYRLPDGRLLNVAFVLANGRVIGAVPKSWLPNYGPFEEARWFTSGLDIDVMINDPVLGEFRLSRKQLFQVGRMKFGIEICEDGWVQERPSIDLINAGAHAIFNPSASNEEVGKPDYRYNMIRAVSGDYIGAYVYSSSGTTESTRDLVFGGHQIAAENGVVLYSKLEDSLQGGWNKVDLDIDRIMHDRTVNKSFANVMSRYGQQLPLVVAAEKANEIGEALVRKGPTHMRSIPRGITLSNAGIPEDTGGVQRLPFIPSDPTARYRAFEEILNIQARGLARRLMDIWEKTGSRQKVVIGVSGGLDSTLALLVAQRAIEILDTDFPDVGWSDRDIVGVTMPGFGTSGETKKSALDLMDHMGITQREISIHELTKLMMEKVGHEYVPGTKDVVFQNIQARDRTEILMTLANKLGGIVLGTGDLTEICLGWCTFNGDHMSMYNVNASIPKSLVKFLVRHIAETSRDPKLESILLPVVARKISPELLEANPDGSIAQSTEEEIGPLDFHDFMIWHFVRNGFEVEKIFFMLRRAFPEMSVEEILRWMDTFFQRFDSNQYKRSVAAPGPKVGLSASPRGDLRMPDELDCQLMLTETKNIRQAVAR